MGQSEVLAFLEKNYPDWYSSKQIAKALNLGQGSVITSLKALSKGEGFVRWRSKGRGTHKVWQFLPGTDE